MKYLFVFFFAGFFLADAGVIKKYDLFLETEDDKFQGRVTLTLSDSNNNRYIELDKYHYNVTKCIYFETQHPPDTIQKPPDATQKPPDATQQPPDATQQPPDATQQPPDTTQQPEKEKKCEFKGNKITFLDNKATPSSVVLTFEGGYRSDGLSRHKTEAGDRLYVANMNAEGHKIIFPCLAKEKAEFEFEGDAEVVTNLKSLRGKDEEEKISLRDLIFIRGDIVMDDASIPPLTYYRMKKSEKMGQKLKNVMEKVVELGDSILLNTEILFTPVFNKTGITSRDFIFLSDEYLKSDDSETEYFPLVLQLTEMMFQRRGEEKKIFLDSVGPRFAAIKITGQSNITSEGYLKYIQTEAFKVDGFNNSKSLNELASLNQGSEVDDVLNSKGLSVLYSLDSLCGNDKVMEGLSNYIKNDKCKVDEAFQGCFEKKDEAKKYFDAWADGPGYPVVHVTSNKTAEYNMNQERFLWFGSAEKDRRWMIRAGYKTKEGSEKYITLPATKDSFAVTINSTYFILDHSNTGFYRVNYDAKLWEALISQLKSNHTEIDPVSRMKLIDDVFSFPKSTYNFTRGIPGYVTALKLSEYLRNETDFRALLVAFDALGFIDSALNSSYHGKFRDHFKSILNNIYNKTAKGDLHDSPIKDRVILLACKYGVEECIRNATKTFDEIRSNATQLSREQKLAICSVIRNNSTRLMDTLALFNAVGETRWNQTFWLACSRDKTVLSLLVTQFITEEDGDGFTEVISSAVEHNPDNVKVILDIIKSFEGAIIRVFGRDQLKSILRLILRNLNPESASTLKEIAKNLDEPFQKEVKMKCDHVQLWAESKAKDVADYFKKSGGSQVKPIALVSVVATVLPLANHIFHI